MLMALESGELAAHVIIDHLETIQAGRQFSELEMRYRAVYKQRFNQRLRICSLMRRAAFIPGLAELAIGFFGASDRLRRRLTLATRYNSRTNLPPLVSNK